MEGVIKDVQDKTLKQIKWLIEDGAGEQREWIRISIIKDSH